MTKEEIKDYDCYNCQYVVDGVDGWPDKCGFTRMNLDDVDNRQCPYDPSKKEED